MNQRRMTAVQVGFLLAAMFANAVVKNDTIRITVLDSETRAVSRGDNGVPKNCDQVNFDAYCRATTDTPMTSTLLVQEGNGPPFRITCRIESRFSRCKPLPKGGTFDAKREKNGIVVYYEDDKGKPRKQLYAYVAGDAKSSATSPAVASETQTAPSPVENTGEAPAPAVASASAQETVKCSFSSSPPGAEVTVDGRYVGSTPSVLSLSTGNHTVEVSLPGFVQWKRELTVSPGSELTVNAVLEKAQ